jgi:hypothetical protein
MSADHIPGSGPLTVPPSPGFRFVRGRRFLVLLLIIFVGAGVYQQLFGSSFKKAPNRPGWSMFESRTDGWSVQFPDSWKARRTSEVHRGSPYTTEVHVVTISNVDRNLKRVACGENCRRLDAVGLPSNGIVVQIGWSYGGGFSCRVMHDTPLPLSLAHAERTTNRDGEGGTPQLKLSTSFTARLNPGYRIVAWIGSKATKADLDILDKIVGSVSYDAVDPAPPDERNAC